MSHLIQNLFLALGGFATWLYAALMNIVFSKNNNLNIGHYLFEHDEIKDNSGMDTRKKKFVIGIFVFIFIITILQYN